MYASIDFRIQPGLNSNSNALPPLAEVDENQNAPPAVPTPTEPIVDTSINPDIVRHIPDQPDQPEEPATVAAAEQAIGMDALQSEVFGENGVGDFATETAMDSILREAEINQEPPDVYIPKVMEDIHGKCTLLQVFVVGRGVRMGGEGGADVSGYKLAYSLNTDKLIHL